MALPIDKQAYIYHEMIYGSNKYLVAITKAYSTEVIDFLYQHLYTDDNSVWMPYKMFPQVFYNIIDGDMYLSLLNKLTDNKSHAQAFYGFKTEQYSATTIGEKTYYFLERDHTIIYKENFATFIVVDDTCDYRYQLLRVLREYIYRYEEDNGKVFMHAAACACADQGYLILGRKESGKTTLLNYLLECEMDYIANDRAFVSNMNDDVFIEGFPIPMRISYKTITALKKRIDINKLYRKQSALSDKALITPYEVSRIYNVNVVSKKKLKALIIPQIHIGDEKVKITSIEGTKDALSCLIENCYTPVDESRTTEWICCCKTSKEELMANANTMINRMLTLPVLRVEYGTACNPSSIFREIMTWH